MTQRMFIVLSTAVAVGLSAASALAETDRERADRHHEQAKAYFRVEAYRDAIAEWQKSYDLHPNPNRLFNLGRAYEEIGDAENAIDHYRRYVEGDPDGPAVAEANARILKLERELEEARAQQARREALAEARDFMAERDYDAAIEAYERAYEASEDPDIVYEIAQAHRLAGDFEAAIAEYGRYLELAPDGDRAADALAHRQTLETELEARSEESSRPDRPAGPEPAGADMTIERAAEPSSGGWSGMRIAGVSSLGVAAVGAGAGVFFGLQARSAQRTVEGADGAWSRELDEEVARGEAAQRNTVIATVVSGAALVTGGALLYLDLRSGAGGSAGAISVAPTIVERSAGLAVGGRF